ncbi:hypothetical protein QP028_04695 [Corynebacterium suedekumii]|nr:hypothetical protein QP028_04695 [Corynebacterium suedekumii]
MTHATATAVPTTDLDLFSDEVLGNPTTYHNQLREQGTVVRVPANDVWAITRYDQVRDALGDPLTFSSTKRCASTTPPTATSGAPHSPRIRRSTDPCVPPYPRISTTAPCGR